MAASHQMFQISETCLLCSALDGFVRVPTTEAAMAMDAGVVALELVFEKHSKHIGVFVHTCANASFVAFHAHHQQFESTCMAETTHLQQNGPFLTHFELVALALHGGAGQSVQKDKKKSFLETMMNFWEMDFNFGNCSWANAVDKINAGFARFQGFSSAHYQFWNENCAFKIIFHSDNQTTQKWSESLLDFGFVHFQV